MFVKAKAICLLLLLSATGAVFAQGVTTGAFNGTVTDKNNGEPLPGVVIEAVHEPTGTRYSTVTRANGAWRIFNVRVGGPYTITATMSGFQTQKDKDIFVKLGESFEVNFELSVDTVEETITVVSQANAIIDSSRTGSTSNVSKEVVENLPSISRSFEDFARTNPYVNVTSSNDGTGSISVAGRPNRYNNIQIDGAVNNDLFGLAASGTPGGQAEAPYISLDAIDQLQVQVSPFDVRHSGFTGGAVNAVTRTGSNQLDGSVFYFQRDDSMIGDGPFDQEFGSLDETQTGFRVGGPIIKDTLFFFANAEQRRLEQPAGWAIRPDGETGSGQNFGFYDEAVRFRNILLNQYGYDPGGLDEVQRNTDSDTIFARLDWNINDNHNLTFRHNFVDAENLRTGNSSFTFQFPGNHQFFPSETNSTVLQVNSTFGNSFNEFRLSYTTVKDRRRGVDEGFPWVEIEGIEFEAGTERFSTANALDQDILSITNDFTFFRGNHTITIGTHNEIFGFDNLFIRENFGAYEFASLDDFEAGRVRRFNYSFSSDPNDPQRSAEFDVQQLGFYINNEWAVTPDFNLTMGVRMDIPMFPDNPTRNPLSEEVFGFRTDEVPDGNLIISPRLGFNWDINGDSSQQLRGGVGVFAGRMPWVWFSNQYSNTGIEFSRFSYTARDEDGDGEIDYYPFEADPNGQYENLLDFVGEFGGDLTPSSGNEINLIDPDFELPQVMRFNLAYERDMGWQGVIGTVELLYGETLQDVRYSNLNFQPTGETFFDGRPLVARETSQLRDVILLDNTTEGSQFNATVRFERPWRDGLYFYANYTYGDSESINDGNSSQARSNWRFNLVGDNPNAPEIGTARYEVKHRINLSASYRFGFDQAPTTVSLFYNARAGRPYSITYRNDVNGDGESNDLLFVPENTSDAIFIDRNDNDASAAWEALLAADEGLNAARGSIFTRNSGKAPWRRELDFRLSQDVNVQSYKFQLTLDILNFLNFLDDDQGVIEYVSFNELSLVDYEGIDEASGKPIYELQITDPERRFTVDNLRSRYQMKLGVRFTF